MKIAYFDCLSGIAGDMTLAALIDAGVDLGAIQAGIDSLGPPSCRLVTSEVKRGGFRATHLKVEHEPEHAHRHLHHITDMIDRSILTDRQKDLAKRIFTKLGEAEAKVHGTTLRKVHFHEVGAVDSIADVVGAAIAWDLLGADRFIASPIPTGHGFVEIAHGRCSIPAPATAELLTGIPLAPSNVAAELTTPTGAAIVATLATQFGPMPALSIDRIGYGAGTRELPEQPNILRVLIGQTTDDAGSEQCTVVETNLDDVTGEVVGYCVTRLWDAGALDVYTLPIQMKKNRPGVLLSVLCNTADVAKIEQVLFRETTTLGIRRYSVSRTKLARKAHEVETAYGRIAGKLRELPGEPARFAPEFESCKAAAEKHRVPLRVVYDVAVRAFG